jgi:histone H3/H4
MRAESNSFAKAVTGQAVARACIAHGLKTTSHAVIDSLVDVVIGYVESLASIARERAEMGGRVTAGIQDILPAVEQLVHYYSYSFN